MLLSRMLKHAGKARAGLLAVGVRTVADQEEVQPYAPLMTAHKRRQLVLGTDAPSAIEQGRDALTPREVDPSLSVLHSTNTDVDPDLLLSDWRMAEIRHGPLMQKESPRAELEEYERVLRAFKEQRSLIPVRESMQLCDQLNILYGRHVIEVTLSLSKPGFKAFSEAGFKRLHKRLDTLRRRSEAIEAALEADDIPKALDITRRALLACERFEQHLTRVLREVSFEQRLQSSRARKALQLAAAGGMVVVGVTFDFFGFLPAGLVSSSAMDVIGKFAAAGAVVCLSASVVSYFHSHEAKAYIHKLRRIGLDIQSFKHTFEDQRDDAELAAEDMEQQQACA